MKNKLLSIQKNIKIKIALNTLLMGIIFTYILHLFGDIGRVFLPIHIFVIIGAYILPPVYAVSIAVILPLSSSFLTGMPVVYPILPIIILELMTYALIIGFLKRKNIYFSLILAMISGRITAAFSVFLLGKIMGLAMHPIRYIESSIITGIPGIIFQIIIIPIIITLINNHSSPWSDLHEHN